MFFQNESCFFIRKPPGIASSRGDNFSILNAIHNDSLSEFDESAEQIPDAVKHFIKPIYTQLGITKIEYDHMKSIMSWFKQDEEFWLLNRLDTPTSWLLYFAKSKVIYDNWKQWQRKWLITKHYVAITDWLPTIHLIDTPIAHHKNWKKMIVVDQDLLASKKRQKIKWKSIITTTHLVESIAIWENYLNHITISKWQRHQIRAHLSYIWAPIIGEKLYNDYQWDSPLQLYSIWCSVSKW